MKAYFIVYSLAILFFMVLLIVLASLSLLAICFIFWVVPSFSTFPWVALRVLVFCSLALATGFMFSPQSKEVIKEFRK